MLVVEVINLHDAIGDESDHKYHVSIEAVSPESAGNENLDRALESWGLSDEDIELYQNNPIRQVEALSDYGIAATLWSQSGNNIRKLMRAAQHESELIHGLFGFYMDRPQNRIGQSGWDRISGQNVRTFLDV